MPEVKKNRPAQVSGLNLGTDEALLSPGDLEVANGIRPLRAGAASSRNGRTLTNFTAAELPVQGYHPFYDESLVTADDSPKSTEVLRHLYKGNGSLYLNSERLGAFLGNKEARFEEYDGRVYAVDSESDPLVIRRKATQTVGAAPQYEAARMGIAWPVNNNLPTVTVGAPGSGSWNSGRNAISHDVQVRITIAKLDGSGDIIVESNPSLVSTHKELNVGANFGTQDKDVQLTIDWSALEASLPSKDVADRINIWVQIIPVTTGVPGASGARQAPLAYKKVVDSALVDSNKLDRNHASYDSTAVINTWANIDSWHELELIHGYDHGAPPALIDIRVVNDVMVGIARRDVVYREISPEGGAITRRQDVPGVGTRSIPEANKIKAIQVDGSQVFFAKPFHPEYMQNSVTVGNGSEPATALAVLGRTVLVFTSKAVYFMDLFTDRPELKISPAQAGTDSPDSVIETSQMILFRATDGTWYRFNGATFDEISDDIAPLFRSEESDYTGYYRPVDQAKIERIRSTSTSERVYITYPQKGQDRHALLVGDQRKGKTRWYLDTAHDYRNVHYVPNEKRLLAITENGVFFWIEEGLQDQLEDGTFQGVFFETRLRRNVGEGHIVTDWKRAHIEVDTQGETVTAEIRAADDPARSFEFSFSTTSRAITVKRPLPTKIRGRHATLTLRGTVNKRVHLYGMDIRGDERGEF